MVWHLRRVDTQAMQKRIVSIGKVRGDKVGFIKNKRANGISDGAPYSAACFTPAAACAADGSTIGTASITQFFEFLRAGLGIA